MTDKKPERFACYLRTSSTEQREAGTIETQRETLAKYAEALRLEVAGVYADDGVSGLIPFHERPEGARLLEDAKAGTFDAVLVYKLDRLGRKLAVVADAHDRLQSVGVALRSIHDSIDTSTAQGRLFFNTLAGFAEYEKEAINERTKDGKDRAYRNGVHVGVIPYGYDIADDGSFVIVEEEAAVVREIISNIANEGGTLFTEAKRLNLESVPTPGKRYRGRPRKHAKTWTPMAISRIVGRKAYSGTHVIHSSSGDIERPVPAIVPAELQDAAIARLEESKRYSGGNRVREYLLRGLIRCEEHGWRYSGTARKRRGGGYLFKYLCPYSVSRRYDTHREHGCCPTLDALWLEGLVWGKIREYIEHPDEAIEEAKAQLERQRQHTGELEERLASLRERLKATHREKDGYIDAYAIERRTTGKADDAKLAEALAEIRARTDHLEMLIESTEADLAREEHDAEASEEAARWLASLRDNLEALEADTDEARRNRRRLVEELVEHITVSRAQDGRASVRITFKFAAPVGAASGVTDDKTFEILAGDTPIREALERI